MIRPLTHRDCETVAALIRCAFAATEIAVEPPPSALRVTAADVGRHLDAGGGGAVADADGCVLWSREEGGLYMGRLAVRPEARGRGLAEALVRAAEEWARAAGLCCLRLEVRLALTGNRRLFRRLGFVEGEQHAHPGYAVPTYVSAEKRLLARETSDAGETNLRRD